MKVTPEAYCGFADCRRVNYAKGFCVMHYRRWKRHGDPNITMRAGSLPGDRHPRWIGGEVRYIGMHKRLYAAHGRASLYPCSAEGCINQAKQWAYDHLDPEERAETQDGYLVPYSVHVEHYVPLCVSCHKKTDLSTKRA